MEAQTKQPKNILTPKLTEAQVGKHKHNTNPNQTQNTTRNKHTQTQNKHNTKK